MVRTRRPIVAAFLAAVAAATWNSGCSPAAFTGGVLSMAEPPQDAVPSEASVASRVTMGKVADVVAESLGVDKGKVVGSATLSELGASSLMIVDAVVALEETFQVELADAVMDIELPTKETAKLKNVQDVANLIQTKLDEWVRARSAGWATM